MADQNLPYEYQSQIIAAERRKQLAEALQKQAFGFSGAQGQGRIMPKTSPLAWLANTAAGYLASKGAADAEQKQAGVMQQAEKARQAEMLALLQAPEGERDTLAAGAKFPQTQGLAKTLYDRKQAKLKTVLENVAKYDPVQAANLGLTEQLPTELKAPAPKMPQSGTDSAGNTYSFVTDPAGKVDFKYAPKGLQVINNPAQTEKAALIAGAGKIPEIGASTKTEMERAVDQRDKADRLMALAKDPDVITGFGADPQRFVASLAAKLNLTGPDAVAKTQSLLSNIAEQTLDASLDLKGAITEKEWPRLAQARAGEISYSPAALLELGHIARAKAHNQFIRAARQRQGVGNFAGGEEVLKMYPTPAYGSAAFPENLYKERPDGTMQYVGSIEAILGKAPKAVKPQASQGQPLTVDQLSPEQRQMLLQMLQGGK